MLKTEIEIPSPPKGLRKRSREFWQHINESYVLQEHHLQLLEQVCRTLDRIAENQEAIRQEGRTYVDRYGQPKIHPCGDDERQQRNLLIRLMRELCLDNENPEENRSPRLKG